jgi:hypothetical protein
MKDGKNSSNTFLPDRKNLEEEFVDIDNQLSQLEETKDLALVRRIIPIIRARLFKIYNFAVYSIDIEAFASHKPGYKTPLN